MPWVFLVALLLLLLKGFQWLQHLQLPLPVLLAGGIGLAVLSNSGLKFPSLPRPQLLKTPNPTEIEEVSVVESASE